ncbi:MAG: four helix bundle protein [Ignavibacteriales bacterium]|nr:four helix bundle protein [Ignavibacteriales bacterium]
MEKVFSHEKLNVYKRSLDFVEFADKLLCKQKERISACDQLDRASTSIPLNIAEGSGKFSSKDKSRYYDIARGSATESAACLDVLLIKKKIETDENSKGKEILFEIVSMLIGLIKSTSDRIYEDNETYNP